MAIKLGNTDINKVYLGSTEIKKIYLGSTLIFDNTLGPELVSNGDFANGTTDWVFQNGSTVSGGVGIVEARGSIAVTGANHVFEQTGVFPGNNGLTYRVTLQARQTVGSGNLQIGQDFFSRFSGSVGGTFETVTFDFVNNTSNANLTIGGLTNGDQFEIDDVSVRQVL